jgi:hypothetical protein
MLNEEDKEVLLQMCGNYAGLPTQSDAEPPHHLLLIAGLYPLDERSKRVDGNRENSG